jgi:hypothetical protein
MEHENPLAESIRTDFEPRMIRGERVFSTTPRLIVIEFRIFLIKFAVVENHSKHPIIGGVLESKERMLGFWVTAKRLIAIFYRLQILI